MKPQKELSQIFIFIFSMGLLTPIELLAPWLINLSLPTDNVPLFTQTICKSHAEVSLRTLGCYFTLSCVRIQALGPLPISAS